MTNTIINQVDFPPPILIRRVLQGDESNNTERVELPDSYVPVGVESGTAFPFSHYVRQKWNRAFVHGILGNKSVDITTAMNLPAMSSTLEIVVPEEIDEELTALVYSIRDQNFDDILESDLVQSLTIIIDRYGKLVFDLLYTWIVSNQIDTASASDLVILIGRIKTTHNLARLDFLERCLHLKPSVRVRYASVLALAYVDDRSFSSIASVRNAIEDEPIESLKKDMLQLLAQLQKPPRR